MHRRLTVHPQSAQGTRLCDCNQLSGGKPDRCPSRCSSTWALKVGNDCSSSPQSGTGQGKTSARRDPASEAAHWLADWGVGTGTGSAICHAAACAANPVSTSPSGRSLRKVCDCCGAEGSRPASTQACCCCIEHGAGKPPPKRPRMQIGVSSRTFCSKLWLGGQHAPSGAAPGAADSARSPAPALPRGGVLDPSRLRSRTSLAEAARP